jgi:hypothetical protein
VNSQCSGEDDEECEGEVGEVDAAVWFGADGESFEAAQPGVGAFDDPAVAGVWVAGAGDLFASAGAGSAGLSGGERLAWSAALADLGCDPACVKLGAEWVAAVAAVGPDLAGLVAGALERVDER